MASGEYLLTQSGLQVQTLLNKVRNPATQPEASERLITAGGVLAGLAPKYEKPSGGIPASDLTEAVQELLNKVSAGNAAFGQGYGTCTPPLSGVACEVTLQDYLRLEGGYIAVKVSERDMPTSATLNVNGMGAQPVIWRGSPLSGGVVRAGDLAVFVYAAGAYQLVAKDTPFTYDGHTFFGTCATAGATAAKVTTISGFNLGLNVAAVITFTNAVTVPDATLNIRNTGAKPIYINGAALQPGVIRAGMTAMMVYDGMRYNIVSLMGSKGVDERLYVDLGLTSGTLWARSNLDLRQTSGFAASPFQYECSFFSWANTFGVNPKDGSQGGINAFFDDYDWGGVNAQDPWYEGQVYGSTAGAEVRGVIPSERDAASVNVGLLWHIPSNTLFEEMVGMTDAIRSDGSVIPDTETDKTTVVYGVRGLYRQSKINGERIFFAACGRGASTSWLDMAVYGRYWSNSELNVRLGRDMVFYSVAVFPNSQYEKYTGLPIRPVIM